MQEETVNLKQQIMEILKPQLTVKSKIEYICKQISNQNCSEY